MSQNNTNNTNNKIQNIKYTPPPSYIPILGDVKTDEVSFIGRTNYVAALEEKKYVFGIHRNDRTKNVYITGKNGTGKTKMLELFIRQDIDNGHGLCLLDSNNDLINSLLDFVPFHRIKDVCIIDPSLGKVGLNPFVYNNPEMTHQLSQQIIEIFKVRFGSSWNHTIEYILRFIILALGSYKKATIYGILEMLTNPEYREEVTSTITDESVKNFWVNEFDRWYEKFENEGIIPLRSKLSQFMSHPYVQNIFTAGQTTVSISDLIESQKIILVHLPHDVLGEENFAIAGSLITALFKNSSTKRNTTNKAFYLYIDNFDDIVSFGPDSLFVMSKKNNIPIVLVNESYSSLGPKIQSSLLSSVGNHVIFRLHSDDASKLKNEYSPVIETKDMVNLATGEFYIKMIVGENTTEPFSAETLKILPPPRESYRDDIIKNSYFLYSV